MVRTWGHDSVFLLKVFRHYQSFRMARESVSPLKLPHRSPIGWTRHNKIGPIRIIHSDSTVSVISCAEIISTDVKRSIISILPSLKPDKRDRNCTSVKQTPVVPVLVPTTKPDFEEDGIEKPLLCCQLFALVATCFQHFEDQVVTGRSWCQTQITRLRAHQQPQVRYL